MFYFLAIFFFWLYNIDLIHILSQNYKGWDNILVALTQATRIVPHHSNIATTTPSNSSSSGYSRSKSSNTNTTSNGGTSGGTIATGLSILPPFMGLIGFSQGGTVAAKLLLVS